MFLARQLPGQESLQLLWEERCRQSNFSYGVLGIGTILGSEMVNKTKHV